MIEPRLRAILLAIAATGFAGMVVELVLTEHWGQASQIIPFVLSAAAVVSIGLFALRPGAKTAVLVRVVMIAVIVGAVFGILQHVGGNADFARETHAGASTADVFWGALRGTAPALAPGGLAMAALVALVATWGARSRSVS